MASPGVGRGERGSAPGKNLSRELELLARVHAAGLLRIPKQIDANLDPLGARDFYQRRQMELVRVAVGSLLRRDASDMRLKKVELQGVERRVKIAGAREILITWTRVSRLEGADHPARRINQHAAELSESLATANILD